MPQTLPGNLTGTVCCLSLSYCLMLHVSRPQYVCQVDDLPRIHAEINVVMEDGLRRVWGVTSCLC